MSRSRRIGTAKAPGTWSALWEAPEATRANKGRLSDLHLPRADRQKVSIPAVVMSFGGLTLEVTIQDISRHGLCVEGGQLLPIGGQVMVITNVGGSIPAHVRWALGRRSGCYFNGQMSGDAGQFVHSLLQSCEEFTGTE